MRAAHAGDGARLVLLDQLQAWRDALHADLFDDAPAESRA
jgi:hypothetical protein